MMKGKTRKQLRKIVNVIGYRFAPHMDHFAEKKLGLSMQTVMKEENGSLHFETCQIRDGQPAQTNADDKNCLKSFAAGYSTAVREFVSILEKK